MVSEAARSRLSPLKINRHDVVDGASRQSPVSHSEGCTAGALVFCNRNRAARCIATIPRAPSTIPGIRSHYGVHSGGLHSRRARAEAGGVPREDARQPDRVARAASNDFHVSLAARATSTCPWTQAIAALGLAHIFTRSNALSELC